MLKCHHAGCNKAFATRPALTMHVIRAHGKGWSTTANFKTKKRNPLSPDRQAMQRLYNARMRERYRAQGLTSAGKPRKRPYIPRSQTPEAKRSAYLRQRDKYYSQGLNAKGKPFGNKHGRISPEGLRNIAKATRLRHQRERAEKNHRIQFVYPVPTKKQQIDLRREQLTAPVETPAPEWVHAQLHYCPKCGENLASWKKTV